MSAKEKKINNYLITINNIEDIKDYKKVGVTAFLFALKDYSIGYEKTYTYEEINSIPDKKYVLINTLLNTTDIDNIRPILNNLKVDGFVFEDVGLINLLKDKQGEKILFINHFNTNSQSINNWLEYVDSVVISNELTLKEYQEILPKVNKNIVVQALGYNQIMYSKRHLLKNFQEQFNLPQKNKTIIKDKQGDTKFNIIDSKEGTIILSNKIFNGSKLLDLPNVLYYLINTSYIKKDDILSFINNKEIENTDEGFLNKATYYKLKEVKK